nr:ATP-binding cassette domain-containing protein [Seohaeicola zhoushanensis]
MEGKRLLGGLDLTFGVGWTCLLGPSGSGKSTLLRLIAGLESAARLDGHRRAPERIGWMAQADLLQPRLSLIDNVLLMPRLRGEPARRERAEALLASVGLAGRGDMRPDTLSGGQRQRVALARVLAEDAPVILLDEPFGALDPATRLAMQSLAHDRLAGRIVVMVTHDPAEALRLGNRVLLVGNGTIGEVPPLPPPHPRAPGDAELALAAAALLARLSA